MFDKFGEFDSAEELNRAAAAQKEEGDYEAIYAIAKENGIDREDAQDYIDDLVPELASPEMAAYGKLDIEEADLKPYEIMKDWITYIRNTCDESRAMTYAVRRKGKSLKGCIASLLLWSFKHQWPIDREITKAAGVDSRTTLGIPGMAMAKQLIREYYLGGDPDARV